jgi:hypothetical protein
LFFILFLIFVILFYFIYFILVVIFIFFPLLWRLKEIVCQLFCFERKYDRKNMKCEMIHDEKKWKWIL